MCFNILQNKIYKMMFTFHLDQYLLILLLDPALCRTESLSLWVTITFLGTKFSLIGGLSVTPKVSAHLSAHTVRLLVESLCDYPFFQI